MTCEGLGEMFEVDSADTFFRKFPLMSMGGGAEGLACADPGARTPIGVNGNLHFTSLRELRDFNYFRFCFPKKHLGNFIQQNTFVSQIIPYI